MKSLPGTSRTSVLLIVVDSQPQRTLLNAYFEDTSYRLVYAVGGDEASARFAEVRPDMVLVSRRATRGDGAHFGAWVRGRPQGGDIPVVLFREALPPSTLDSDEEDATDWNVEDPGFRPDAVVSLAQGRAFVIHSLATVAKGEAPLESDEHVPGAAKPRAESGAKSDPNTVESEGVRLLSEIQVTHPKAVEFLERARDALRHDQVNQARLHLQVAAAYEGCGPVRAAILKLGQYAYSDR